MSDEQKQTSEKTTPDPETQAEQVEKRDIKYRAQYKVAQEELETLKITSLNEKNAIIENHNAEIKKASETNRLLQEKVIETKIEAEAIAAGIKDLDFIKIMDRKDIKFNEDGTVSGVKESLAAFKTAKPDLFGAEKKVSTSSNSQVPDGTTQPPKDAWSIPAPDWKQRMNNVR